MNPNRTLERRAGTSRVLVVATTTTIIGIVNALVGIFLTEQLRHGYLANSQDRQSWESLVWWLWPGEFVMMVDANDPISQAFGLIWSTLLTAWLYCLVGLVLGALWQAFVNSRTHK
jgi:hypothetical protein